MSETLPNASPSEKVKAFIADLARPFILISAAASSSWGVVVICNAAAKAIEAGKASPESGSILVGVVLTGVGAVFGFKAAEVANVSKHKAQVETAAIQAAPPQNIGLAPSPPTGASVTPTPEADEGALPADQRITP